MAQRSQLSGRRVPESEDGHPDVANVDSGIAAMVEGVKARGVRFSSTSCDSRTDNAAGQRTVEVCQRIARVDKMYW